MAYNVFDIANKIIIKADSSANGGEAVSNLKLQKLLYYMQGFHLAFFGESLFEDEIEAWQYGPVVPSVYIKYKDFGSAGLESDGEEISLSEKEENLFNQVLSVYGNYSALGLMNLTHQEVPWKTTQVAIKSVISKKKLTEFFKTRLK